MDKKKEYAIKYRQEHKEYFARKAKEYRQRHRQEVLLRRRHHYQEHRDEILLKRKHNPKLKEYRKIYHEKNKEKRNGYSNKYRREHLQDDARRSREYRKRHPDRIRNLNQRYYTKNKPFLNQKNRDRYIALKKLVFSKYAPNQIMKCVFCGENGLDFLTLDHIEGRKKHGHSTLFSSEKLWYHLKKNGFPSGYQVLCWNCNIIKWRSEPKIYSQKRTAIWARKKRAELKLEILSHYSNGKPKCSCCNFSIVEGLAIDHIEGKKVIGHSKDFRSMKLYKWLKNNQYPRGYQVLCYNCNGAKSDNGVCPHNFDN